MASDKLFYSIFHDQPDLILRWLDDLPVDAAGRSQFLWFIALLIGVNAHPDWSDSIHVLLIHGSRFAMGRVWVFDLQGWLTVAVGVLLALITLFSSYSHVDIPGLGNVSLNQQVGVLLLAALVPALLGDAQLATRRRLRAESDRIREKEDRARAEDEAAAERNRATEAREQAARRAGRQARCDRIAFQHQLEPSAEHARQLRNVIALLAEYGD